MSNRRAGRRKKPQKKIIEHRCAAGKQRRVAYIIVGRECVFSGLERPGTTINYAEDIIAAICEVERLNPWRARFYDLQTYQSYGTKQPGEYELDELTLGPGEGRHTFGVESWSPAPRWPLVLETFAEEIGGSGPPVNVDRRPQE